MNEAELVLSEVMECSRPELYLNREKVIGAEIGRILARAVMRRSFGEPIQYVLGKAYFFGLEFKVTPAVLIPRPETELLVEKTLSLVTSYKPQAASLKILDIGTGCGNIAISLAKNIGNCKIIGIDVSEEAIGIAKENAAFHNVEDKIDFMKADLFNLKPEACDRGESRAQPRGSLKPNSFDFVVSNPPYIESEIIDTLQPEVRCEPRIALDGGKDGFNFYRLIMNEAPMYLVSGGYVAVEIGFDQRASLESLVKKQDKLTLVEVDKDYSNQDRIVVMKNG